MTKSLLGLLLALLISKTTIGQVSSPVPPAIYSKIRFSLMAGPSLLSVRENEPYNQWGVAKFGYSAGVGIVKGLTSHLQVQGKVMFERKGYKTSQPDSTYTGTAWATGRLINNRSLDYLTFSMTPQFLLGKRKKISVGVGGYYGRLLKTKWQIIVTDLHLNTSSVVTGSYHKDDYGITMNIGYSLSLIKKFSIGLQLTENYGFRQVAPQSPFPKEKNNNLVLTVAVSKK